MLSNVILSYDERMNVRNKVCDDIDNYKRKLLRLEGLYNCVGMDMPVPCYANFRDALFHYVKIYESADLLTINGNLYTLKEHLDRSVKDAIVHFLNVFVSWMEKFCVEYKLDENVNQCIFEEWPHLSQMNNWSVKNWKEASDELMKKLGTTQNEAKGYLMTFCVRKVQKDNNLVRQLRKYLHVMKNHTLKLRSSSSVLARPYSSDEEFEAFEADIRSILMELNNTHILSCLILNFGKMEPDT